MALRAAIFMPVCFALASWLLDPAARPFTSFGAFILLAMVTFAGRPGPRLVAWLILVVTGCVLITVGTLLSQFTWLAALAGGLISFVIFFSGVVNPYFAAARSGAVLLIALPLMVEADASAIPERLAGWLLAAAICIPATYLVWRLPWHGELRRQAAKTARALAGLAREPSSNERKKEASDQVWRLRKRFLATPNRPTGATGQSAALASVVDEMGWTYGLIVNPGADITSDRPFARELRDATAGLLESSGNLLDGKSDTLSVEQTELALRQLVEQNAKELRQRATSGGAAADEEELRHLDLEFRLRKLAYSAIDVAETAEVASGGTRAPGVLGETWSWTALRLKRLARTRRVLASHTGLKSSWMRNSVRAALGIALAVLVADLVAAQNAFWVVLGTLSVLRSNAMGTRGSAFQAIGGTLGGILLGTVVIVLLGDESHILWIALPLAVFFAAYAQRAVSFAASQAGFSLLVMVLYNLIEPVGWEVGLIRIQDVAIGCGVSLVVGLLVWPRGAADLIRGSIATALEAATELVRVRARAALEGNAGNRTDAAWRSAASSSELLDAALRQYLDEASGDHIDRESLMALSAAALRLRRTAEGIGRIPDQPWFRKPGLAENPRLTEAIEQVCESYLALARSISPGGPLPESPTLGDARWLLGYLDQEHGGDPDAGLARIWLFENLQYLTELHQRFAERAQMLFDVSSEDPAPTGDIPLPRPVPAPVPVAQSG